MEEVYQTELAKDGYEKIEEKIQKIENLANEGTFAVGNSRFYQIAAEAKKLRRVLREVMVIVPGASGGAQALQIKLV